VFVRQFYLIHEFAEVYNRMRMTGSGSPTLNCNSKSTPGVSGLFCTLQFFDRTLKILKTSTKTRTEVHDHITCRD